MWRDSESKQDFLNFTELADQIATLATTPTMLPISIGVFGSWGTGKSTVLSLTEQRLDSRTPRPIIVKFDAWLYQGFDDSKAALMEVVASTLTEEAKENTTVLSKIKAFSGRINYFRALGIAADVGVGMALGVPPGLLTRAGSAITNLISGEGGKDDVDGLKEAGKEVSSTWADIVRPEEAKTPPKEIAAFRKEFEEILTALKRPLILFIDNLDRCLPDVAIGTLEAVRLFLFIEGTAFIVAADEDMVRHSVAKYFKDPDTRHVKDYLDKVIQVPFYVPRIGAEDVRAYMYSLFVQLHASDKLDTVEHLLLVALQNSWDNKSFTKEEILGLTGKSDDLLEALSVSDRLAPILASAPNIGGNPRIVKRLLNAITLRQALAKTRRMNVDLATLAKIAVFERSTDTPAAEALYRLVMTDDKAVEHITSSDKLKGTRPELPTNWKGHSDFVDQWREMEPHFNDAAHLRPALFLSRDVLAPAARRNGLSDAARQAVEGLLNVNSVNSPGGKTIAEQLSAPDAAATMNELIAHLREEDWTKAPVGLHGAIILSRVVPGTAPQLKALVRSLDKAAMGRAVLTVLRQAKILDGDN